MNADTRAEELAKRVSEWVESDPQFARFVLDAVDGVLVVDLEVPGLVFGSPALRARVPVESLEAVALASEAEELVLRFAREDFVLSGTVTLFPGACSTRRSLRAWSVTLFDGSHPLSLPISTRRWIESLPHFVWTCMSDGRCDYLSPQWVAYTGTPEAEQLGYGWLEFVHPDDRDPTNEKWAKAAASSETFDTEFRLRRHDGTYRWFKTRAVAMRGPQGQILRWLGSNTDVQELHEARERLEERVAERTAELRSALENLEVAQRVAHLGSWALDVATGEVQWTDELFRILGREPGAEAPNFAIQQSLFVPESWARLTAAIAHSVATGEGYELELTAVRPDGRTRVAVARATSRMDGDRVTHLLGTFHDVTELAEACSVATRAAERSRLATEAMGLGVWDLDLATGELIWDERMYELYGLPVGERVAYDVWSANVVEEDRDLAAQAVSTAIERAGEFDMDFRVAARGGVRVIHALARVIRAEDGRPLRMVGLNRDVTVERKLAAEERTRNALVEQFIRDTPAAIAMFDSELRVQIMSQQFRSDFGAQQELVGKPLEALFNQSERWRSILAAALDGEVLRGEEEPFEVAEGRLEWLTWEARPWQGETRAVTLFTRVVSDQRMLRATIEKSAEELRRSNHDLEQFAYAASHDLQEPLRAVSGCALVMKQQYTGRLDAQADELLHHMVDGAERMRALITGLLAYSRVTSRGRAPERFPAQEALDQALANLRVALDEGHAEVSVGRLPTVDADRSQLVTLFQNLVGNAIKYRRGGRAAIHVDGVDGGEEWIFSVRDDGIGIEPRYHKRVFELFQRLHTRADYPGTGIGLALCTKIVERHGGRMWVDSQLGVGSTFCFSLPKQSVAVDGGLRE